MCLHFYGAVAMRITLFIDLTIEEITVERCPRDKLKKIEIHTMGIFAEVNSTYLWK
jgi:pyridoxine 5'-phosphate synthase PdxJ